MGGSGSGGSSINPGSVAMSGGSGIGNVGSLGGGLYQAYKDHFDYIYATKADIKNLNVLSKLTYRSSPAEWMSVVQSIDSINVFYGRSTKRLAITINYTVGHAVGSSSNPRSGDPSIHRSVEGYGNIK